MPMDPERAALEGLVQDAGSARLGPRVGDDQGAAEILRALGQQLIEEADKLGATEEEPLEEVPTEDDDYAMGG